MNLRPVSCVEKSGSEQRWWDTYGCVPVLLLYYSPDLCVNSQNLSHANGIGNKFAKTWLIKWASRRGAGAGLRRASGNASTCQRGAFSRPPTEPLSACCTQKTASILIPKPNIPSIVRLPLRGMAYVSSFHRQRRNDSKI